ncbi:MAG: 16S rRNA (cytosine(1402)-N(4))-methyltransferase RsmH [Candidatus Eisenbacteria bacterium]
MAEWHEPVMVEEVLEYLPHQPDGVYVDGTTGTGGHASRILARLGAGGRLLCADQSEDALDAARSRLSEWGSRVVYFRGSFSNLDRALSELAIERVDGILLDLGLNSWLLARGDCGLSYQIDVPLTMRLDPDLIETAESFLAHATHEELTSVLRDFGDLPRAPLFARRIVEARQRARISTTGALVRALAGERGPALTPNELSRIFGALRTRVNREMERLEEFLDRCPEWLAPGGRLVVISYASHEDRRVKRAYGAKGRDARLEPLLKSPRVPAVDEVRRNPRSRSAKLRAFVRGANDNV